MLAELVRKELKSSKQLEEIAFGTVDKRLFRTEVQLK